MVDNNKDDALPETEVEKDMDDKSINDLLKEYAEDVKDKDLDEFLKDSGDDAYESDDASDDDDLVAAPVQKKSGGFLTLLMTLVVCGAAGAGAWIYLNKDEGMTNVMGGFSGEPVNDNVSMTMPTDETPPAPEAAPTIPPLGTDPVVTLDSTAPSDLENPFPSDVPAPTPIMNEADATTTAPEVATDAATTAPVVAVEPALDAVPAADTAVATPVETPAAAPADTAAASQAVDDWMASATDGMAEVEAKLPETPVTEIAEVKAKPVSVKKEDKAPAVKVESDDTVEVAAPKKRAAERSPLDDALSPPYVAIQAQKGGTAPVTTTTSSASTTKAGMAPVVEGDSSLQTTSSDVAGYKRGSTAATEPSETRAAGVYKDLVKSGGGMIELPGLQTVVTTGTAVPMGARISDTSGDLTPNSPTTVGTYASSTAAEESGTPRLAIQGGKSLPPGRTVRTSATSSVTAQLPQDLKTDAEPKVAASPVIPVETAAPKQAAPAAAPATSSGAPNAQSLLRAAAEAEGQGNASKAIELYQRALELDAVYGDGKSIDRGMVYDRIGALRAK